MIRFLRYNSRHCLWFPRGWQCHWLPQLNPLVCHDQRAASFTSQFYSILIGIQRPPIQGGNKGPGSPQA
jgi:hypothetical protein